MRREATSTESGVQIFRINRIRTRVQQVVVRHMCALPRFFFEIYCPTGSSKHNQQSHPGKEGRTRPFDKMGNINASGLRENSPFFDAVG